MKEVSKANYLADILSLHQHPTVETTPCLGEKSVAKQAKQSLGFIQVSLVLQIPFQEVFRPSKPAQDTLSQGFWSTRVYLSFFPLANFSVSFMVNIAGWTIPVNRKSTTGRNCRIMSIFIFLHVKHWNPPTSIPPQNSENLSNENHSYNNASQTCCTSPQV